MEIIPFRTPGLGDQTYLFTHEGTAVLVDPQRDIDRFLDVASERDLELRFVLETHLHNDYVSGALEASKRTGAELVLPAAAAAAYRYTPAFHLEDLPGEKGLTIRPIHTPGHTPEHTSYVVLLDGVEVALFSGGSLLVGSAGRPDLLGPERADTLARLQYISLNRLAKLPAELGLYPTHGEGSFCTSSGAGKYTSTVGEEAATNPLLQLDSPDAMSEEMLRQPMPIPYFYRFMGPANTLGVKPLPKTEPAQLTAAQALELDGVHLVDIRPRTDQAKGVLPGSTGIELADDFGSWAGWLVPYDQPAVLIANPDQDVDEAVTQLRQIQFDNVVGVVTDLTDAPLEQTFEIVDAETAAKLAAHGDVQVLDVRMPNERAEVTFPGATERFVADLFSQGMPDGITKDKPVLIACGTGRRATIAASYLAAQGYPDVQVQSPGGVAELVAAAQARG